MFESYPFIQYGILDIDKNLHSQGYTPHSFDIIIGANVLHDARDINLSMHNFKSLLVPNGLFVILELTWNARFHKITTGFIDGFSNYADERMKENVPLLSAERWRQKFSHGGFSEVASFPEKHSLGQHVVVARGPGMIVKMDPNAIRNYLLEKLPEYMVPSFFVELENIPLTANGKVDRKALPAPQGKSGSDTAYAAPRNELEIKIIEIWQEVLKVDRIGINDNFFELGGDSLKAIKISAWAKKENIDISIVEVFASPTVKALAKLVPSAQKDTAYVPIPKAQVKEHYEMSSTQKWMYQIQQSDLASISFNMPSNFRLKGTVRPETIECVLKEMVERHEILRTRFDMLDGEPVQVITETGSVDFEYVHSTEDDEMKLITEFIKPFDLAKASQFRVKMVNMGEHYLVMFDMHHIISDGTSQAAFVNEFVSLYNGKKPEPLTLQYKDYSEWMLAQDLPAQKDYWANEFSDEIPVLNLPLDYVRPQLKSSQGASAVIDTGNELGANIKEFASKTETTEFMVFLASVMALLGKYSNQEDVAIGSPIAGRTRKETENMLGAFINMLVLRGKPAGEKSFEEFLDEVKTICLNAFANQEYPFVELVKDVGAGCDPSRSPLFDVVFVLENMERAEFDIEGIAVEHLELNLLAAKYDLVIYSVEHDGSFKLILESCTALFKKETAEFLLANFVGFIKNAISYPEKKLNEISFTEGKALAAS
jgi:aryl carrier-like protein